MDEIGLERSDKHLYFGQLFGMCDYITYSLGIL